MRLGTVTATFEGEPENLAPKPGDIRIVGARYGDVLYTHITHGDINASAATRAIVDRAWWLGITPLRFSIQVPSVIAANMAQDISPERVLSMTRAEAEVPVILMECPDRTAMCIDGNNRIRWRLMNKLPDARAYFFPYPGLEAFRARIEEFDGQAWALQTPERVLGTLWGRHDKRAASFKTGAKS